MDEQIRSLLDKMLFFQNTNIFNIHCVMNKKKIKKNHEQKFTKL